MPFIKCHDLEGHLDETIQAPSIVVLRVVMDGDEKISETDVCNPEYVA